MIVGQIMYTNLESPKSQINLVELLLKMHSRCDVNMDVIILKC